MTNAVRKNINVFIPFLVAGYYIYRTDKSFNNWKTTLPVVIFILIIVWIITRQATNYIYAETNKPDDGTIPANAKDYDEGTFCKKIYNDIYCIFCFRDKSLYYELAGMPDAYIIAVNKYWNDNYYSKDNESLRMAINNETLGWELSPVLKTINSRFDKLKIQ